MDNKENPFEKISSAYEYALENNINPKKPETWDDNYRKKLKQLAGIIPIIEAEIKEIKKVL